MMCKFVSLQKLICQKYKQSTKRIKSQKISVLHYIINIYIIPHILLFYRMLWSMEEIKIIHIPLVTPCCDSYGLYASRNNPTLVDKLIQKFILVAIKYSMHGTHESRRYDQSITKVLSIRLGDKSTVQSFGPTILNVDVTIAYYSFFFFFNRIFISIIQIYCRVQYQTLVLVLHPMRILLYHILSIIHL